MPFSQNEAILQIKCYKERNLDRSGQPLSFGEAVMTVSR